MLNEWEIFLNYKEILKGGDLNNGKNLM